MTRFWALSGAVASATSLMIASLALRAPAIPRIAPTLIAITQPLAFEDLPKYSGPGSCAAAACHGGGQAVPASVSHALRNEHTTWIDKDAHAGAYDVLFSDRSKRIAKNLGGKIEAHLDPRCTACHETPHSSTSQSEGVSCESCHGPSAAWLSEHTVFDWKHLNKEQKASFGFRDLNNKTERAKTCAGCHVGSPAKPEIGIPARDVNHDLIAAGHPRLNWEFSAYSANYPKHWRIPPPEAADIDARLWMVGQVATMVSSLDLLIARADEAETKKAPWPEFTEYGCFSCHFSLKEDLKTTVRDPDVPLGVPAWGSWTVPMLKQITSFHPAFPPPTDELDELRRIMGKLQTNPADVKEHAVKLRHSLNKWLDQYAETPLKSDEVNALFTNLWPKNADGTSKSTLTKPWDIEAQLYLGLAAVYATQKALDPTKENPKVDEELKAMLKKLAFKDGFDSPHTDDSDTNK